MLMGSGNREAKIHYLDGTFRLLAAGDHVRCAITGAIIPIDELRYWSAERQEAYAGVAEAFGIEYVPLDSALTSLAAIAA